MHRATPILMETFGASISEARNVGTENPNGGLALEIEGLEHHVDELNSKVDKLTQKMHIIYNLNLKKKQNMPKGNTAMKDKDKEKHVPSIEKQQLDASCREAAATKRMQELMRQFGVILCQITQHRFTRPFMQPVDVEGLGLHDYYEIIDKPMDFSTIKNKMEAKDGTEYKHVREICADVRLVFKNAMKYNAERSDIHELAKILLAKFEEKWLQLQYKVTEEETRQEVEEAEAQLSMQLGQEGAYAKLNRDLFNELQEVKNVHLEELRKLIKKKKEELKKRRRRAGRDDGTRLQGQRD